MSEERLNSDGQQCHQYHLNQMNNSRLKQLNTEIFKFFSLINSCKSFNYSGLPSTSPLYPICTCLSQSQSLFCLNISPLIYLFVSSSSISPKFPLFNYKYIYWKRVNSYWCGGPHLISDFDFIISVYMLYILCVKCKFSLSIMLC